MKTNLSRTSFEEMKANEVKTREEVRHLNRSTMRGTLPTLKTSIEVVEAMWAKNTNWIEL